MRNDLPRTLEITFEIIIDRIRKMPEVDRNIALGALSWVFHNSNSGLRPLKIDELLHLLNTREGDSDIDDNLLPPARRVLETCQSLIVQDSETGDVKVAHYTVQEFLQSCQDLWPVPNLARTCVTYLSFDIFNKICRTDDEMDHRRTKYKASCYVAYFWGIYARQAEDDSLLQKIIIEFLTHRNKRDSMLQLKAYEDNRRVHFTKNQSILHIIAGNGLTSLCDLFVRGESTSYNRCVLLIDMPY